MSAIESIERRYSHGPQAPAVTARRAGGGSGRPLITGYAAVFYNAADPSGTQYELGGPSKILERIMPRAFDQAISGDVRALFNHEPDNILGRTVAGTLKLSIDSRGLRYEIDPPETALGKAITVAIERGDVSGSSFGFVVLDQRFREEIGGRALIREILDVSLTDVGPVTFPAYAGSSAGIGARGAKKGRSVDRMRRQLEMLQRFGR